MGVEEALPAGLLLTTVEKLAGYARKSSVWPATFGLACCAIELMQAGSPRHDLARFGMEKTGATPRQADLMIVGGRVSQKMAPVLRQIYDQMPDPKWVISMGVCASSGGMFNNYAIVQGVDRIVPVDIYLPGCPPRPEMLIDAIVKLHDKIQNMKLGVNRERQITELEEAGLRRLPLVASAHLLAEQYPARPRDRGSPRDSRRPAPGSQHERDTRRREEPPTVQGPPIGGRRASPQPGAAGEGSAEAGGASRAYDVAGQDWDELVAAVGENPGRIGDESIVVNMGPQHPSTHGVLRLVLTLDGETVTELRPVIGYLHTGIEKNAEYRSWTQGVTFVTRADYLMPIFNETAYCLAVERLLGIEDRIPERASVIRVLLMELNRISSHLGGIGPWGLELGATTVFTNATRSREKVLDVLELITGLRMNHAFIRPGGVVQDIPAGGLEAIREFLRVMPGQLGEVRALFDASPVFRARTTGIAYLDVTGCMALGVTGPMLRATGLPWDLRKSQPYCGYESYEFDVPVTVTGDAYGRYQLRMDEMDQSLRIIEQCVDRLAQSWPASEPVMISDAKIGWPARLALGPDGLGNSPDLIAHIMGESMEALIHHFKLVTDGFRVPAGQAYAAVESPRGELGCHLVSDGGTRPYRVHLRDPSFSHLQALPALVEGGMIADVIPAVASIDPIMGGVDR